ncbi:MAG TPA: hypothetical protein DDW31_05680 [candidate division Zixibacteria bacterium]|nr:hypothetical protein [candidate division Zixibacteria bacterium]
MNADALLGLLHGLREYLPLLIFLVVLPATMYVSYRSRKASAGKLSELAAKLGLQYQGPEQSGALETAFNQKTASRQGGDRMRAEQSFRRMEQSGFLKSLLTLAQPLAISGRYNGFQAEIRLVKQNKKSFTETRAFFSEPLGLGLKIERSGFWGKSLSLNRDARIESGNAELDKMVAIRAGDGMKARYIARNLQAQTALLELFRYKGAEFTDQGAVVRQDGHQTDYAKAKKLLDDMTRAMLAAAATLGRDKNAREESY